MIKKSKIILIYIFALFFVLGFSMAFILPYNAKANVLTSDLVVSYDCSVSSNEKDIYGDRALKIKALSDDACVDFADNFSKEFSSVFSVGPDNFSGIIKFIFSCNGYQFETLLDFSRQINACVLYNGQEAAIHYENDLTSGNSSLYNKIGEYTSLNRGKDVKLSFNALDMTVYVASDEIEYLVWDFSNEENDGVLLGKLDDFENFNVKIQFPATSSEIYIKKINGTNVSFGLLGNDISPMIVACPKLNAIVGQDYYIPEPVVNDFVFKNNVSVNVKVIKDNGEYVLNEEFVSGIKFTPELGVGYYKIIYTAENGFNNTDKYDFLVKVYSSETDANTYYDINDITFENCYGLNSLIYVPNAVLVSDIFLKEDTGKVFYSVKCNGIILDAYSKIDASIPSYLKVVEAGDYTIEFFSEHNFIDSKKVVEFTVLENIAGLEVDYLKNIFYIGESVSIPQGSIYYNNEKSNADIKVIYPSGDCYENRVFTASEKGLYTIIYSAEINNTIYEFEKNITIIDSASSLFTGGENTVFEAGYSSVSSKVKGIHVTTKNSENIIYNNVIDLNKLTRSDLLLELMADNTVLGTPDFTSFNITLTDVYNANNYITIVCTYSTLINSNGNGTYIRTAASNGQTLLGLYKNNSNDIKYETGYDARHSFIGLTDHEDISENTLKLYFDYSEYRLYSGPTWGAGIDVLQDYLVADYNDPYFYSNLWNGFTTGEVYLTINVKGTTYPNVGFIIKTIAGKSLADDISIFNKKPEITILYDQINNIPFGIVGKQYKLFDATARELENNQSVSVEKHIIYNYGKVNCFEIDYNENYFTPIIDGVYTVIYSATDKYGNSSEKIIEITVFNSISDISFTFEADSDIYTGQYFTMPDVEFVSNASGSFSIEYSVSYGTEKNELINNSFKAEKQGIYEIAIKVSDYLGRYSVKTFTVNSQPSEKPIFEEEIILPEYFIVNHIYELPLQPAYDYYSENREIVYPQIYVTDMNNMDLYLSDGIYSPKVSEDYENIEYYETVIKYVYQTSHGNYEYEFTKKTLNAQDSKIYYFDRFFDCEKADKEIKEEGVCFTCENGAVIKFANSVLSDNFQINFIISKMQIENIEGMSITLKDINTDVKILIYLKYSDSGLTASINGNAGGKSISLLSYGEDKYSFGIRYSEQKLKDISDSLIGEVLTDYNQKEFNGFVSKKVYVSVNVECSASIDLYINKINNQVFTSSTSYDRSSPEIEVGDFGGYYDINSAIVLEGGFASDILSEMSEFSVTVRLNDGQYITAMDGTTLNKADATKSYKFVVSSYGIYTVEYIAKDTSGRSSVNSIIKNILVVDKIAPEIVLQKSYKESYEVGEKIEIIDALVSDNTTENPVCVIYIMKTNGDLVKVKAKDNFTFDVNGKYFITYMAYDADNNLNTVSVAINVI